MTTSVLTNKFSLTEYVIQDIQNLTKERVCVDIVDDISYFIESEVAARIVGLSLSFFATLDAVFYMGQTLKNTTLSLLYNLSIINLNEPPSKKEIACDLNHIGMFAIFTLIGPILGALSPRCFIVNNQVPADNADNIDESLPKTWEETSEDVRSLWARASNKDLFIRLWNAASLKTKRVFVHVLDLDNSKEGLAGKARLVNIIYGKLTPHNAPDNASNIQSWPKQSEGAYYHATILDNLEGILKSGELKGKQVGSIKGPWVSTCADGIRAGNLHRYVLVFKRNIERLSHLYMASEFKSVWAHFKEDIPVDNSTLAKVILVRSYEHWCFQPYYDQGEEEEKAELEVKIEQWLGHKIPVEIYKPNKHADHALNHIYPKEWPIEFAR